MSNSARGDLERFGYVLLDEIFDIHELNSLAERLAATLRTNHEASVLRSRGQTYGSRNLLAMFPDVSTLLISRPLLEFVTGVLGCNAGLVRALYFDKPPGRTWSLPWHKDRTIAVKRNDIPSSRFRKPTLKTGISHVEAPDSLLAEMLTLRIHLDEMTEENGPLSVIPASHDPNVLSKQQPVQVRANVGDVLAMRPLLSHSSSSSRPETTLHRRVIHLELASHRELPDGYEWHTYIPIV